MEWYEGDIGTAIAESKSKKLIFLVYTFDTNSESLNKLWNKESVYEPCKQNCISIKLDSESQPCNQFRQIYPISTFPTTYLIGNNGKALEVINGLVSEDELASKIQNAINIHNSEKKQTETIQVTDTKESNQEPLVETQSSTSEVSVQPSTSQTQEKSIDERVALAKEKLKQIQEKKRAEEEEKERNIELERRKLGQDILKAKREKEEQELRKIAEDKRKEKLEDELAKQRIREKIQQDREEKQKKYAQEKDEIQKAKEAERARVEQEKLAEAARNSNVARLQFRFVDGSSVTKQFDPNQALEEARQFVAQKLKEMNENSNFTIHSSFPKKEFTPSDMLLSLRELNLAPSASLLVIPVRSKVSKTFSNVTSTANASTSTVANVATDIASLIFLPFTIIWGLITSLFGMNTNNSNNSNNRTWNDNQSRTQTQPSTSSNLRRRNPDNQSDNIRNLRDIRDDDENATWNGNSTQQM